MPKPKALTGITLTAPKVDIKILQLTIRHETKYNTENILSETDLIAREVDAVYEILTR